MIALAIRYGIIPEALCVLKYIGSFNKSITSLNSNRLENIAIQKMPNTVRGGMSFL